MNNYQCPCGGSYDEYDLCFECDKPRPKRKRFLPLAFIACLALPAWANNACYDVDTVTKLVDGDTVDVRLTVFPKVLIDIRVRLLGIDAPESRTRDLDEKALGLAAKARLGELVQGDIQVCIEGQGKYGRWLGTLKNNDGQSINQQMIDEGHAVPYDGGTR